MERLTAHTSGKRGEGGFILISALLVTAILVAVLADFVYSLHISTSRAANFADGERASIVAADGVELAGAAIEEMLKTRPNMAMGREGVTFRKTDGDAAIEVTVVDELSKVSTRIVYEGTGVADEKVWGVYARLLKSFKLDERLAETLADWIDADDNPRVYGGEGMDYYQKLPRPFRPKNSHLETTEELLLVKGYSRDRFDAIKRFITPYSSAGLVNLNTAPREVLMALSDDMTDELARKLVAYREKTPFRDRSDIMKVPGFDTVGFALQDKVVVRSDTFRIYSRATVGETIREVEAVYRAGGKVLYWRWS